MPHPPLHLAHIINPVNAPEGTELHTAQPLVFESMRRAAGQAKNIANIELLSTQYPEDHAIIPEYFTVLPDLERSVLDVGQFNKQKKLPLIADILQQAQNNTEADYIIFTNADIVLMPFFYEAVTELVRAGHDALIINRRRIQRKYDKVEQLPLIFSELGMSHPGYDCFVMKRSLISKLVLGEICVGIPFIGVSLAHNLFAFADNLKILDDKHLTVHLGMEVMPQRDSEYYAHNKAQFDQILTQLKPHLSDEKLPYFEEAWSTKVLKRGLNPSIMSSLGAELEIKGRWANFKYRLNNIRFQLLQKR